MLKIVKTEILKLKRYHILWAGIVLMLLSVMLTLFTSMANDGSVWDFTYMIEQVIKNNMSTIFPMCITLITGYIITREQKDNTLKNILTIPISFKQLLVGKLLVCGILSLFLGMVCTIFTIMGSFLAGFPGFSVGLALQGFTQITFVNLFLYIAVMPIIILTSRFSSGFLIGVIVAFVYGYCGMFAAGDMKLANLYPITASLGLIHYRSYDPSVHWNSLMCSLNMVFVLVLSAVLVLIMKNNMESNKIKKQKTKIVRKKGW
ncbi:ABC transporter permease [Clostridium tyrobutyricum]|uniref:ABC transporter permease n=1 Tax=Clostridium tyrobutyricum TaxID=1519 RepID=UPI00073D3635|nr:ABC transporter permease [Clostridium tyrobutyricum]